MPEKPTKERIVAAALETLRTAGIAGASARAIARTGGFNQALIFYHFGSVEDLYLAACDELSARRVAQYTARIAGVTTLRELVEVATELHREDTAEGHIAVLSQLLAGSVTIASAAGALLSRPFAPRVIKRMGFRRMLIMSAVVIGLLGAAPALFRDWTPVWLIVAECTGAELRLTFTEFEDSEDPLGT